VTATYIRNRSLVSKTWTWCCSQVETGRLMPREREREMSHHVASPERLKGCQLRGWNPSLLS